MFLNRKDYSFYISVDKNLAIYNLYIFQPSTLKLLVLTSIPVCQISDRFGLLLFTFHGIDPEDNLEAITGTCSAYLLANRNQRNKITQIIWELLSPPPVMFGCCS